MEVVWAIAIFSQLAQTPSHLDEQFLPTPWSYRIESWSASAASLEDAQAP